MDNEVIKLDIDDTIVRYSPKGNEKIESDKDIIAKLDTVLTEKLKDEGMARKIVRNVQDARKQLNCKIFDRIMLQLEGMLSDDSKRYICNETLANLTKFDNEDFKSEVTSNSNIVVVKIKN